MSVHRLAVAPMEGVTGFPMRLWLHLASAPPAMTTPFLRVTKGQPEKHLPQLFAPELFELEGALPYELTPQFLAGDADNFLRAAAMLDGVKTPAIELNCGCPCPTCIGAFAGSGILAAPDVFAATVARLAATLGPQRLAIKMRLGFLAASEFDSLLIPVTQAPLARLTVHGRTRQQGYSGQACWDSIGKAAALTMIPTWGSGDVVDASSHSKALAQAPQVAGVLIGRGLLRNPWIFTDLQQLNVVVVDDAVLGQALYVFALLNHLAIEAPSKLLGRVANGRLPLFCGTDSDAWERAAAELSTLAFGVPRLFSLKTPLSSLPLSPNVWPRLRYLWGFLRATRSSELQTPRLLRVKSVADFFAAFAAAVRDTPPSQAPVASFRDNVASCTIGSMK